MTNGFDAPKSSRSFPSPKLNSFPPGPRSERRRAPRRKAQVPVFVYGRTGQAVFYEDARSKIVSARGALLCLTKPLAAGQKLLLTNTLTQAEQLCRVASAGKRAGSCFEVPVEFLEPAPHFWRDPVRPRRVSPAPSNAASRLTR